MLCTVARHLAMELCSGLETYLGAINAGVKSSVMILRQDLDGSFDTARTLDEAVKLGSAVISVFQKDWASDFSKQDSMDSQHRSMMALASQVVAAGSAGAGPSGHNYRLPPPPQQQGGSSRPGSRQGSPGRVANVCDNWRKHGSCPRGSACSFAASHISR